MHKDLLCHVEEEDIPEGLAWLLHHLVEEAERRPDAAAPPMSSDAFGWESAFAILTDDEVLLLHMH